MTLGLLGQRELVGTHFTDGQEKDKVCGKVSAIWTAQCKTIEQGQEELANQQKVIEDIRSPLSDWRSGVINDQFALFHKRSGRHFIPTKHCLTNLAYIGRTSSWMLEDLTTPKGHATKKDSDGNPVEVFKRDSRDADVVCRIVDLAMFQKDRVDQDKPRLFRTWSDGTLRAVLSEEYAILNNQWFLELIGKLVPGGLLSHWRGDADTIFGNVLVPDSIRQEQDSQYGGMLSIGNSEIGTRRYLSLPSVFRAICMNGCIWEQEKGKAVNGVHRGKINYERIASDMAINVQRQLPLLNGFIDSLLATTKLTFGEVSYLQVFAQVFTQYKLPKSISPKVLKAYATEVGVLGNDAKSLFGVQAALTRAGQLLDNETWVSFDEMAGQLAQMGSDRWEILLKKAANLSGEDVVAVIGDVGHI